MRKRINGGRRHLEFSTVVYRDQLERGNHVLHEHPVGASSWKEECIDRIPRHSQVSTVVGDMCQYGMMLKMKPGIILPVKKPTRWMSSSYEMLNRLRARCDGTHTHASLLDGKAKQASIWIEALCIVISKGIRDTNMVAEYHVEIEAIEMEARCINSFVIDNEFSLVRPNLDYRAGFPVASSRG